MWETVAVLCMGYILYLVVKRKAEATKSLSSGDMLGFHWGDSVDTVAKWAKKIGLRYVRADNSTAAIVYTGRYPNALPKAAYNFFMPDGKLDSIAVLINDASAYTFGALQKRFFEKHGDSWDLEDDNASWLLPGLLIVLFQGPSGYLHIRYLNLRNLTQGRKLEDEHDAVIDALRGLDAELAKQLQNDKK